MSDTNLIHYLILSAILFSIAIAGMIMNRKNVINILMCVELMLLAININFVSFSKYMQRDITVEKDDTLALDLSDEFVIETQFSNFVGDQLLSNHNIPSDENVNILEKNILEKGALESNKEHLINISKIDVDGPNMANQGNAVNNMHNRIETIKVHLSKDSILKNRISGQVFSIIILAIAAAEAAIGLAIIVAYYRKNSSILLGDINKLRG